MMRLLSRRFGLPLPSTDNPSFVYGRVVSMSLHLLAWAARFLIGTGIEQNPHLIQPRFVVFTYGLSLARFRAGLLRLLPVGIYAVSFRGSTLQLPRFTDE
jgi:hypothetical protein